MGSSIRLDLAYGQKHQFTILIRNDLHSVNRLNNLTLRRATGQAGACSSRVIVYEPGGLGDSARRTTRTELTSTFGSSRGSLLQAHLGVGKFGSVDVRVVFLPGTPTGLPEMPTNSMHMVSE
jgi:hypothetical protein